jgi:transcriptional regulator with XRE-family HTH domain
VSPTARLAENLRKLRLRANLTQEQLAEVAGFEIRFYQALEQGSRPQMKLETIERLGLPFGLEAWQMLAPHAYLKGRLVKMPKAKSEAKLGPRAKWSRASKVN